MPQAPHNEKGNFMATDLIGGMGGGIASLFGSDKAPRAVLNRFAAPTAKASQALATGLLGDAGTLSKNALDEYMAMQPKFGALAGQQENVANTLLNRRLSADPNALLQQVGQTAFGFINPSVINPLAQFDINSVNLMRRARGINPAAIDSTSERLRNARIASGRYYDVARDAYQALPNLFGQAYNQMAGNEAAALGMIPQVAQTYEGVATRPTTGLLNRINAANAALGAGASGIANVNAATQGFKTPRNWADRIGAASQEFGSGLTGTLNTVGSLASGLGGAVGGGGL